MGARDRLQALKEKRELRKSQGSQRTGADGGDAAKATSFLPHVSPAASSGSPARGPPTAMKASHGRDIVRDPTPLIAAPVDGPQPDLWAAIVMQGKDEYDRDRLRERVERKVRAEEQRKFLDEQVKFHAAIKEKERQRHVAERAPADEAFNEFQKEQEAKKAQRRATMDAIGADRAAQIHTREEKKEAEKKAKEFADALIMENIRLQEEEARRQASLTRQRREVMKHELVAANEDLKHRREEQAASEREQLRRLEQQMVEREEREFRARLADADAFKEKVKGREAMALRLQASIDQQSAVDEARANLVIEERIRKEDDQRAAEDAKREKMKQVCLFSRARQIEEQKRAKELEAEAKVRERQQLEQDFKRAAAELEEMKAKERAKLASQREITDKQVAEKARYKRVVISTEEMKLNKHLLERVGSQSPQR